MLAFPDVTVDAPFVARTVQEARAPTTPVDTSVELASVVVVAVDLYGVRTGEFWVQQSGGGIGSGIHIYGAITSEVAALHPGDIIDVGGGARPSSLREVTRVGEPRSRSFLSPGETSRSRRKDSWPLLSLPPWTQQPSRCSPTRDRRRTREMGRDVRAGHVGQGRRCSIPGGRRFIVPRVLYRSVQRSVDTGGLSGRNCARDVLLVDSGRHRVLQHLQPRPARTTDAVIGTGCP